MKELLLKLVASDRKHLDGALLFLRLFIGGMMLSHGWAKLASFSTLSATFPDPLGVGSTLSLLLILIFGLMTRLAALPLMFGMLMAFFVIHGADPFAVRELPLLYLGVYVFLLWGGAGSYSLDEWIRRRIIRREIAR